MITLHKVLLAARDPKFVLLYLMNRGIFNWMDDAAFLKLKFRIMMKKPLDLETPQTFNEKLQWLKLHDRRPLYTQLVDKYGVRSYIAETIGEAYLIPLVGGPWNSVDEIDFDALPEQFVLKCTHDSGGVVICPDKGRLSVRGTREKLHSSLRRNYFWSGREWPYRNVKPRIIAEKYMVDESGTELKDYKVFCFQGVPRTIQVDFDRFHNHRRNLYSPEWKNLGYTSCYPTDPSVEIPKPVCLDKMLALAAELSKGIPHLRTDFYVINSQIFFGELTLYHGSGLEIFDPPEWDRRLGDWIDLSSLRQ